MEWLIQLAGMLLAAGAVYGGIRNDLRHIQSKAEEAKATASRAHVRIDDHIDRHHVRGAGQ